MRSLGRAGLPRLEKNTLDLLERQIRRNVLLGLIAEIYEKHLTDAISVREWLQSKLADEPAEDERRCEKANE